MHNRADPRADVAEFSAPTGFALDHGLDARNTFFVFAFFPIAMVVLLSILGRIQRTLPPDLDGSLIPASAAAPVRT
jgi:AAHS family 4-hydroxybenzoate transporter-like MFS transporter